MKKVMVALVAVASAFVVNAATCAWNTEYVEDLSENDVIGNYWIVALTGTSIDGIGVSTAGELLDANGYVAHTYVNGVSFDDPSAVGGSITGLSAADNSKTLALIVVDNANAYWGIATGTLVGIADDPAPADAADITFTNYTDSYDSLALQTNQETIGEVVPEPTSGLLLLLGMAGLALRRKQA